MLRVEEISLQIKKVFLERIQDIKDREKKQENTNQFKLPKNK